MSRHRTASQKPAPVTIDPSKLGPNSPLLAKGKGKKAILAKLVPTEAQEQIHLMELLVGKVGREGRVPGAGMTTRIPDLALIYAINPNPRVKMSERAAGMTKAMGAVANIPDIHWPVARGPFIGLYVELKRESGSYGTKGQREMAEALREAGNCVIEAKGCEQGLQAILGYNELRHTGWWWDRPADKLEESRWRFYDMLTRRLK